MDIIPSHLRYPGEPGVGGSSFLSNVQLRPGEVQEAIYPQDPRNRSKRFIEYSVYVQHRENGTAVTKIYPNCILMNSFGGFADQLTYTLRAEANADTQNSAKQSGEPGKGSKVLVLCLNGETHSAIIVGGLRDASRDSDPKSDKDQGHHLHFAFNGVIFDIDKDGQLTLQVTGATDAEGKTENDELPSTLKIEKSGKITAETKDGKNSIVIDKGTITVTAEDEVEVTAGKATIKSDHVVVDSNLIELGQGAALNPGNAVMLGSAINILTSLPFLAEGGCSTKVFALK